MTGAAERLSPVLAELLGAELPIRLRGWDGVEAGPPGAPVLVLRNRRALRHLIWRPDELGLARAFVSGDLEVDPSSDLYDVLTAVARLSERTESTLRPRLADVFGNDVDNRHLVAITRQPGGVDSSRPSHVQFGRVEIDQLVVPLRGGHGRRYFARN